MSRSRKHISIRGIIAARSEKQDKRISNRSMRRVYLKQLDVDLVPNKREVADIWGFNKDGKAYFDSCRDPAAMRK